MCGRQHHDPRSGLCFDSSLQRVSRTSFRIRAFPGVVGNVRCHGGIGIAAADPGRRQEPLHALDVSRRCTRVRVHVTAANPLRARRHPNLVTRAIVSNHCACRVAAVTEVIAWKWRIIPARVSDAIMNGIMPVVIVIGVLTIPTAIMRLKRVMRPPNARIGAGYDNVLAGKTQRPYLGRMRVIDARLYCRGPLEMRRRLVDSFRLRKMVLDQWIAFDACYVRPGCQCLCDLSSSIYQDYVNNVEGAIFESAFAQPLQN